MGVAGRTQSPDLHREVGHNSARELLFARLPVRERVLELAGVATTMLEGTVGHLLGARSPHALPPLTRRSSARSGSSTAWD